MQKLMQKRYLVLLIIFVLFSFVLAGCADKGDKKGDEPYQLGVDEAGPEAMYQDGLRALDKKKYDQALGLFESIKNQYPLSPLAVDAELKIADVHFKKKDYLLAAEAYKEFAKMHPIHPDLPYVYFQIGMSYQKEAPRWYDRDISSCHQAIQAYGYLETYFPESSYAQDNKEEFDICRIKLGKREFYVGRFYYKQKYYDSAIPRFDVVINQYSDLPVAEDAYYYKAKSYFKMDKKDEAIETLKQMLYAFPAGEYSKKGRKIIKESQKENRS